MTSGLIAASSLAKAAVSRPVGSINRNSGARLRTCVNNGSGRNSRNSVGVSTASSAEIRGMREAGEGSGVLALDGRETLEDFGSVVTGRELYRTDPGRQ